MNEIQHTGVLGMKWGVRKSRSAALGGLRSTIKGNAHARKTYKNRENFFVKSQTTRSALRARHLERKYMKREARYEKRRNNFMKKYGNDPKIRSKYDRAYMSKIRVKINGGKRSLSKKKRMLADIMERSYNTSLIKTMTNDIANKAARRYDIQKY